MTRATDFSAAASTIEMAVALNLVACLTPLESLEGNDIAETFIKIFKRDYVGINPTPRFQSALAAVAPWVEDYNEVHPRSGPAYHALIEYIAIS